MASIADFITQAESVIMAITPAYLPGLQYRLAPKNKPLAELIDAGVDTHRSFQVTPHMVVEHGHFNGDCYSIKHHVTITFRYLFDDSVNDSFIKASCMASADAAQVVHAMLYPPATVWTTDCYGVEFISHDPLTAAEAGIVYVYTSVLTFLVEYAV